jgi:valyl-tRNA synthetase
MNIPPSLSLEVRVQSDDKAIRETLNRHRNLIVNMARLNSLTIQNTGEKPKSSATAVISNAMVFVSLEGIIDFTKETNRLEKEINKLANELAKVAQKLENKGFLSNAPVDVIEKVKEKHTLLIEKQDKLQANLDQIKQANDTPA